MKSFAASCLSLLAAASIFPASGLVRAEDQGRHEIQGALLLAEIVLPGQADSVKKTSKSAAEARGKAKAYQESGSGNTTIIVIPEEEAEGVLGPRRQTESRATENLGRARQYQQGAVQGPVVVPLGKESGEPTTAERAQSNRARARAYVSTDNTVVIQRIGSDGIPIVACGKLVENVAGRIGDDVQPGGVFFIMRDNKPFKVRCAE